ncbi:MAG: iron-sulfur cluster assembly scaffold protein [Candidatus Bathyarchaeia archaeon]
MTKKLKEEELRLMAELGYSKKAIQLYADKVNVGALKNPDIITTYLGPCGDFIELYLKISKANVIKNGRFCYVGCPGSAMSVSAMIGLVKGKSVYEAKKITEHDVISALGGLPEEKLDCAKLAIATLRKAIAEYEKMRGRSEI